MFLSNKLRTIPLIHLRLARLAPFPNHYLNNASANTNARIKKKLFF